MKLMALALCILSAVAWGAEEKEAGFPRRVGNCTVRVWGAFDTTGGRCRFTDEVMVGIRSVDPLVIRCARLDVSCRGGKREETPREDT